jgi:hypothetical protein
MAKLIADNLHELPHPDPKINQLRLMGYRPFNLSQQAPETRDKANAHGKAIGEGLVELIERNGHVIVGADELRKLRAAVAAQQPGHKIATGFCAHCACEVIRLYVDDEFNAKLHRVAQEAAGLTHNCWS